MMDRKRVVVIHVFDNKILVGQSLRGRMEAFVRDREVACRKHEPHSPVWDLFQRQIEKMTQDMATWDKIRVRGDEFWYKYKVRFVDDVMRLLGPEVRSGREEEEIL